jgi:uncharacterized protein (TIGR03067 family)
MRTHYALVPAVILLLGASAGFSDEKGMNDMTALQGKWTCVSAESDGKAIPADVVKQLRLDIDKGNYTTRKGDQVLFEGTIRLDTTKKPHEIELVDATGDNKGKTGKGIFEVDGDTFKICHGVPPNEDRPKEFVSKAGSKVFLVVWKRQQP